MSSRQEVKVEHKVSVAVFRTWLRENRNGLETHDRGGRKEDREGECVREDRDGT